jgi:hypothetical protein
VPDGLTAGDLVARGRYLHRACAAVISEETVASVFGVRSVIIIPDPVTGTR